MKLRRKIITWTLFSVLFVHYIGVNALHVIYALDQGLFIEWFCVNKNKPKMHCNGACMLSKMENQNQTHPEKPLLPDFEQLQLCFYVQPFEFKISKPHIVVLEHQFYYQNSYTSLYRQDILRPPSQV